MVKDFNIGKDGVLGLVPGSPPVLIEPCFFEEAMPGLDACVVVTITRPTEAGRHAVGAQPGLIGGTRILTAAIGVV
jgi:hypothetical protein